MGNSYYGIHVTPQQRSADTRAHNKQIAELAGQKVILRMQLADKITMMISKTIEDKLIRPGPVAEERECYDMAQELRDMSPELSSIIAAILEIEGVHK